MITRVESKKLIVISDLHIGNPFSSVRKKTVRFIEWASTFGYDICLNGDGFEVAQFSFLRMAEDVPDVLKALKMAMRRGVKVYYVVGNHDIVFEHFLDDWGGFKVAPFLNVTSGESRFRVEHGHLYDPFFVRYPRLYEFSTWMGGFALKIHPAVYKAWIFFEKLKSKFYIAGKGIPGEHPNFVHAATDISYRGFDAVVFGHTHHAGEVTLEGGARYMNPGSWMLSSSYVKIENGKIELCQY